MHDGSETAAMLAESTALGAASAGGQVIRLGAGFGSLLDISVRKIGLDFGICVSDKDGHVQLALRDRYGLPVPRHQMRKIEGLYNRDDFFRSPKGVMPPADGGGMDMLYRSALLGETAASFNSLTVFVSCNNKMLRESLTSVLEKNGAAISHSSQKGQLSFYLDEKGTALYIKDEQLRPLSSAAAGALTLASIAVTGGRKAAYPQVSPSSYDRICEQFGLEYHKFYSCPASDCDTVARAAFAEEPSTLDAAAAVIKICSAIRLKGTTLAKFYDGLPSFFVKTAEVWLPSTRRAYVMRKMQSRAGDPVRQTEGVRLQDGGGEVVFVPRGQSSFLLRAEAPDAETAEELCSLYKREIYTMADEAESS
jgi:phosphomannomutase